MNRLRGAQGAVRGVPAFDSCPIRLAREIVIHLRGGFEVGDVGFLDVAAEGGVFAGALLPYQPVSFGYGQTQIDCEVLLRQRVDFVFEALQPG